MTHRLRYQGGAQAVRSVPHNANGRPVVVSGCDFEVVDLRHPATSASHVLASGSATLDSVATTLAASAGRGTADPRQVTVTSATGIAAGRRYLISSGGKAEMVRVESVSGTTLRLAGELPTLFTSGAAFTGIEVSATVAEDVCGDIDYLGETLLAVRWIPTGGPVYQEPVYLERQAPAVLATVDELVSFDPGLATYARDGAGLLAAAIAEAQTDLNVDLLAAGCDDAQILAGPIGRRAVLNLAAVYVLKASTDPSAVERFTRYHERYKELKANLLVGLDKAKTARLDENNAAQPKDVRSFFAVSW